MPGVVYVMRAGIAGPTLGTAGRKSHPRDLS